MPPRTAEKIKMIQTLCDQLHITLAPAEKVNKETGIIEKVILFTDNEKYTTTYPETTPVQPAETTTSV